MMKKTPYIYLALLLGLIFSCSDQTIDDGFIPADPDFNPFDTINYDKGNVPDPEIDPKSFLGIHQDIFRTKCNQPACHDGTFEPDFRTVESAYNTLVFHPVKRNYDTGPLPARVQPGEPENSMMWRRISEETPEFERMPSSGIPLSSEEMSNIKSWIEGNAKDIYGNEASQSNFQPFCYGLVAYLPNLFNFRVDTVRGGNNFNPFATLHAQEVEIYFAIYDAGFDRVPFPATDITRTKKLKLSTSIVNFEDAVELELEKVASPKVENSVFSAPYGSPVSHYYRVRINWSDLGFSKGVPVFMRLYVQDDDHNEVTEIPTTQSQIALLTYFTVIPS